ncbi:MAG: putative Fe-S cluster assembly protein SufT [Pseudomonadales bacterium]|jgi:probable FeS assembly SUF system protein SufT|nr:putative Fe-S cluster assembly protein SufT [Pseudomonadales bacterium]MDP4640891.1 putative Fe-S cluster assembly protein SufT [Pseudomonadales bacterium]MDP4876528.1 putative Fe-S cluster assembly protein SufT [Pseudomonadales bacterium]MDP4911683.1 putative Fe-S cluster assembly protein SufT [Pseudomonadales bacterium]MDP5059632.1 putative Fe-S cluster assembly protein SufT [Pseudomonadales bacterium]
MSSQERTILTTRRDCPARLVPLGNPVTIPEGTFVTLTQSLGGNYTLVYGGNMVRVDGTDADALGLEPLTLEFAPRPDGSIDVDQVWQALQTIFDPEIPVDLVNLGLIYGVSVDQAAGRVDIQMTLTAPGCGMGPVLVGDVEYRVALVPNVKRVKVDLVFDPAWHREMMSEEAQLETGMFF